MMELADVTDSKSVVGDNVWVRVPLPAPKNGSPCEALDFHFLSRITEVGLERHGPNGKKPSSEWFF